MNQSNNTISPLPEEIEALLEIERRSPDLSQELQDRVWERLSVTLQLPNSNLPKKPSLSTGSSTSSPLTHRGSSITLVTKQLLIATVAMGTLIGAGTFIFYPKSTPEPQTIIAHPVHMVSEPMQKPVPEREEKKKESPSLTPRPRKPTIQKKVTAISKQETISDTLSKESALIEKARVALQEGTLHAAIEALETHSREFPQGKLAEERDALMIVGLAQSGQEEKTREAAETFRATYPRSIFMPVVESAAKSLNAREKGQ